MLQKCLTVLDLTSLGVGSCVGTGMYLVSGLVAKNYAGPAVVFSFMIAALASILSGKSTQIKYKEETDYFKNTEKWVKCPEKKTKTCWKRHKNWAKIPRTLKESFQKDAL